MILFEWEGFELEYFRKYTSLSLSTHTLMKHHPRRDEMLQTTMLTTVSQHIAEFRRSLQHLREKTSAVN